MSIEQTRLQANNENTFPDILSQLAQSKDYITRQLVTANPNTPTATLLNLGAEFPRELINNPIFDLLILEDINFINKIPLATLRSILRQQVVPQFILEQAGERADLEVQLALVNKIETSKKVLQKLAISSYPEVAEAAKLHINLVGELIEDYEQKITEIFNVKRKQNSQTKNNFPGLFSLLSQIASIPYHIIKPLLTDRYYYLTIKKLAQSSATLSNNLQHIANHSESNILTHIAVNPNTSLNILKGLAKNKYSSVRLQVANNPNTPLDLLTTLSNDIEQEISKAAKKKSYFGI